MRSTHGRRHVMSSAETADYYANLEANRARIQREETERTARLDAAESLEDIANRVAPNGAREAQRARLKAAAQRAKQLAGLTAALEQARESLNRTYAHHAALVDTYGEWSAEAREGAGRVAFGLQNVRGIEHAILAIAPGHVSVTAYRR